MPIIVALDQNIWIRMARLYYGSDMDRDGRDALSKILEFRNTGKAVFPITFERHNETVKIGNKKRRQKLSGFMMGMSRGLTFGPAGWRLLEMECDNYWTRKLGMWSKWHYLPHAILGVGLPGLLGKELKVEQKGDRAIILLNERSKIDELRRYLSSAEVLGTIMAGEFPSFDMREMIPDIERETTRYTEEMTKTILNEKARIPDKRMREKVNLVSCIGQLIAPKLYEAGKKLQLSELELRLAVYDMKKGIEFLKMFPNTWTLYELMKANSRNFNGKPDPHDFADQSFLTYSLPYADIVGTERKWLEYSNRAGLSSYFQTEVVSNVNDLADTLRKLGDLA